VQRDPRLLIVMNPRRIPAAMSAFAALKNVTVCYIQGRTETEVAQMFPKVIENWGRTGHVGVVSDDVIVTQHAVDTVFGLCDAIYGMPTSGWCRLDHTSPTSSVCRTDLIDEHPTTTAYQFESAEWVLAQSAPFTASFTGLALHVMHTDWWEEYPFGVYGEHTRGWASDYHLARRLNQNGVDILVHPEGYIDHLKERWLHSDSDPAKRLHLGMLHKAVTWQGRT
jgi:hypothetical protein